MKTQYSRRRNNLITPRSLSWGSAALGIAVLLVLVRLIFPGALVAIAGPLWSLGAAATAATTGISNSFGNVNQVISERDQLATENAALTIENTALAQKAADLNTLLGNRASAGADILAAVTARPPFAPYDTLVLDAGSAAGIVPGALVTGNGGVPLGTILSVTSNSSRVALYSSSGIETAGWIGTTHIPVTLTGEGAGSFSLSLPNTSAVAVGDFVYVPGPEAMPVAVVAKLTVDPSSAFTQVELKPLSNPFSILWVEVAPHALQ